MCSEKEGEERLNVPSAVLDFYTRLKNIYSKKLKKKKDLKSMDSNVVESSSVLAL